MNLLTYTDPITSEAIRTTSIEGEPLFSVPDLCRILDIRNATQAVANLEPEEKITISMAAVTLCNTKSHSRSEGGARNMIFVNESGLYGLIFRSRKPEARRFRVWITSEVLPAIREHGFYSIFPDAVDAEKAKVNAKVVGQASHIRSAMEQLREPLPEGYGTFGQLVTSFGFECSMSERLRAVNAVRKACRDQAARIIYRWHPKDWRAAGYYPRDIAKAALTAVLGEDRITPDLFEN
jgi:prophage antirepressor-like protein